MDFELNEDQRAILEAVDSLLERHAGAERAIELAAKSEYDHTLDQALEEAEFLELALGEDTGPLEAALVVQAVARAGGVVSIGASALLTDIERQLSHFVTGHYSAAHHHPMV